MQEIWLKDMSCTNRPYVGNFFTHICQMNSSILTNWTSPFPILGVAGGPPGPQSVRYAHSLDLM